jgi:hypothetical protein
MGLTMTNCRGATDELALSASAWPTVRGNPSSMKPFSNTSLRASRMLSRSSTSLSYSVAAQRSKYSMVRPRKVDVLLRDKGCWLDRACLSLQFNAFLLARGVPRCYMPVTVQWMPQSFADHLKRHAANKGRSRTASCLPFSEPLAITSRNISPIPMMGTPPNAADRVFA